MRKKSLVDRFGKLPAGMSDADIQAILAFLYRAFDRRTAKQVRILHPYWEEIGNNDLPPEMTIFEFSDWLQVQSA